MRSRILCVLAIVAAAVFMMASTASATVIFTDDFNGSDLDLGTWSPALTGDSMIDIASSVVTLNALSTTPNSWPSAQMKSVATWAQSSNYTYTFDVAANPVGNYSLMSLSGPGGYIAFRNDYEGHPGWYLDVKDWATTRYQGVLNGVPAAAIHAGDTVALTWGPSGVACYLKPSGSSAYTLYDRTTVSTAGNQGFDIQVWTASSLASQAFGSITVSTDAPFVPEPGTLVLGGTGLIGLLAYAWRKRK